MIADVNTAPDGLPRSLSAPVSKALAWLTLTAAALSVNIMLAVAYSRHGVLSGEETSVSMRDPFFLDLHRQYEPMATNIAGHIFYWLGQRLIPVTSLFFGRFEKAIVMSTLPLMLGLYLLKRGAASQASALASAAFLVLMPGFFLFAPLATEYGLECVPGLAALLLAGSRTRGLRQLSAPLVTLSALTYAAGLAFMPAVAWQWLQSERADGGLRLSRVSVWLCGFGVPWLLPFVLWTNHAHLLTGGGTLSDWPTLLHHLGQLTREAAVRGGSYYYFASDPALSQPLAAGFTIFAITWLMLRREHPSVWIGWLAAVGLYLMSGREIGMRRGVPIVVFSVLALGLVVPAVIARLRSRALAFHMARSLVAGSFLFAAVRCATACVQLDTHASRLPIDFDFPLREANTMAQTYAYLLEHPEAVSAAYEPERTWAVLRYLSRDARKRGSDPAAFSVQAIKLQLRAD